MGRGYGGTPPDEVTFLDFFAVFAYFVVKNPTTSKTAKYAKFQDTIYQYTVNKTSNIHSIVGKNYILSTLHYY